MSEENEAGQTYTKQDVINQSLVAFGQGTNFMRVSSRALREFVDAAQQLIDMRSMHEHWGEVAVQVLERVRTMGRVAAALAIEDGRTYIDEENVRVAMRKVRMMSKSDWCDWGGGGGDAAPPSGDP